MAGEVYFDFTLDFANVSIPRRLKITQYGKVLPVLRAKLYNGGTAYEIPSGAEVNVRWKKPTGTVVYNHATSSAQNEIVYALESQCAAVAGVSNVCFEIKNGDDVLQTPVFAVEVAENPVQDGDIADSPQLDALEKVIAEAAEQAQAGFDAAVSDAQSAIDAAVSNAEKSIADAVADAQQTTQQIGQEAAEQARQYAQQAGESASDSESAANRAEAAAAELDNVLKDGPVVSVNGKTGRVTLTAKDLQALPLPDAPQAGQVLVVKEVAEDGSVTLETKDSVGGGFVLMEGEEIPPEERTENTLYFQVTDKHDSGVTA